MRRALIHSFAAATALLVSSVVVPRRSLAADSPPSAADYARLQQDLARVQNELREQRQLILQLMQMHDVLLKYVSGLGGGTALPSGTGGSVSGGRDGIDAPASAGERGTLGGTAAGAGAGLAAGPPALGGAGGAVTGSISGRVRATGGSLDDAYVYVDGPKVVSAHAGSLEIKQRGKQFVPTVAVVPVGTRVAFPNEDKVFHNVFSPTPGDAFDLGTVKAGETSKPVVLLKPGHVEVFCNIHSRMRADVLVVPNGHWTRVHSDGTFQLSNVPVGPRRLVLWGPSIKPVAQKLDVTAGGVTASFVAESAPPGPHLNKHGQAYGSYDE